MTLNELGFMLGGFLLGFGVRHCLSRRKVRQQLRENYLQFSVLHGQVESLERRLLLIDQPKSVQVERQTHLLEGHNFAVSTRQDFPHPFGRLPSAVDRMSKQ